MRRHFQRLTSPSPARRQAPLCSLLIWHTRLHHLGVRIILTDLRGKIWIFACTSSHEKDAAQMSYLHDG